MQLSIIGVEMRSYRPLTLSVKAQHSFNILSMARPLLATSGDMLQCCLCLSSHAVNWQLVQKCETFFSPIHCIQLYKARDPGCVRASKPRDWGFESPLVSSAPTVYIHSTTRAEKIDRLPAVSVGVWDAAWERCLSSG